ncbi:MAG: 50S ribosomal protein L10 [Lentisphaeria bacterium]|nr:MAG: 50S ribosomal protein L10 [Lentisphaeria bacterium]
MRNEKAFSGQADQRDDRRRRLLYFVSFSGLTVKELSDLRNQLAAQNATCHVLKNTLIKKAGELLKIDGLDQIDLTLGTAMISGKGDCSAVAKVLVEYGKRMTSSAPRAATWMGRSSPRPKSAAWQNCRRSLCFRRCCSECCRLRPGTWSAFSTPRLRAS